MNKLKLSIILCLCFVPFKAAVCADSPQTAVAAPFFLVEFEKSIPAFVDNPEADASLNISLSLIDAKERNLARFLRYTLYEGLTPEEYAAELEETLKAEYLSVMEGEEPSESNQKWAFEEKYSVHVRNTYAVISRMVYSYTGGAHGNGGVEHFVVNMENQTVIALDDLVSGNNFPRLKSLVEKELRRYSDSMTEEPLPPGAPLSSGVFFVDDFELGDFYPAEDGLHFLWNTYALAAYVVGAIDVCVAWEDLEGLLTRQGTVMVEAYRN